MFCWLGYALSYYGYARVKGGQDGFIALLWPGRYQGTTWDSGGPPTPTPTAPAQQAAAGATTPAATNPAAGAGGPGTVPYVGPGTA